MPLLHSASDLRSLAVLAMWSVLLPAAARGFMDARRGCYLPLCAGALLLLPFLLSTNILVTVGFVLAERALYLSVAGAALVVARGDQLLRQRFPLLRPAFPIIVVLLALRSATRSHDWSSEMKLFTSGLSVCPSNAKVHYNMAKLWADQGEVEAALLSYREAVRLAPSYEHALNNLGNLEKGRGKLGQAALLLRRATDVAPEFAAAHMNLGIVVQAQEKVEEAEKHYLRALDLRKPYRDCEYNLGNLYLKQGRLGEAEERLRKAAEKGHMLAWGNLVLLLEDLGRQEESHNTAVQAVKLFPSSPELRFHLANSLGKRGQQEEAEQNYLATLSLAPRPKAGYHANLGVLYHRWGKLQEAVSSYQAALALDPGLASARKNLARLTG